MDIEKWILKTKTFWLHFVLICTGLLEIINQLLGSGLIPEAVQPYLLMVAGVLGIILRLKTTQPATVKPPKQE